MRRAVIKNLILGAGITGLSTAYHLREKDYLLLEKEGSVGGLARSKKIEGFIFDCSAHLLHCQTKYFYNWIRKEMGSEVVLHKRNAWIYSHGVYTKYPFQANLYGLPKDVIKECLEGLLEVEGLSSKDGKSFEQWCYGKFGSGISRHFMIPYNQKFWTLHPRHLTTEWIERFIPQPNLRDILDGTFGYGKKEFGYHSKFFYPRTGGIELFVQKLIPKCQNVLLNEEIKTIHLKEKWVEDAKGKKFYFQRLISSIPMFELKEMILDMGPGLRNEFSKLRFVSVYNLNLGVKRELISSKDWIYFPEGNFVFYRVGFPMNFAPSSTPEGYSSIYVDISYSNWQPIEEKNLVKRVRNDLIKAGIVEESDEIVVWDLNNIKYAYIIYDHNWKASRDKILTFLRKNDVFLGGRFGAWHYLSMEGCFLEGKNIADELRKR